MIAIVGGLATAVLWASTLLGSARSARLIGSWSTLGWVMLVGLVVTIPLIVITSPPVELTGEQLGYLTAAGLANSIGLLLVYTALQRGKVGVVGPIVSTEGAIGATLAILAGDPVAGPTIALLALIAAGVALASFERRATPLEGDERPTVSAPVTAADRARARPSCSGSTSTRRAASRPTCRSPGRSCRRASRVSSSSRSRSS